MPKVLIPKLSKASLLSDLKLSVLRSLLFSIGSKTSGTKPVLLSHLRRDVSLPKLRLGSGNGKQRILSIDMGIKNLAFCVCDISEKGKKGVGIDVVAWKRIAVNSSPSTSSSPTLDTQETVIEPEVREEEPFGPRVLSGTAYALLKNLLLPYEPDTILIERQRFRSGGGSAIQEWTVRVNMLEAMLWAVLKTLKGEKSAEVQGRDESPVVWDVSPRKVGLFWVGEEGKGKVEKKVKIGIVKDWILGSSIGDDMALSFSGDAFATREAFASTISSKAVGAKRKSTKVPLLDVDGSAMSDKETEGVGKLDDLADCLLQAVTWVRWESNRKTVGPMVEEENIKGLVEWVDGQG